MRHQKPQGNRQVNRQPRAAFTLVELLVVIGIIALLMSILLPALNRSREQANRSNCLSNLRQLTLAWTMYAQEYDGHLIDPNTNGVGGWVDAGNTDGSITQGLLFPYCNAAKVDRCPADDTGYTRSYSINDYLNGSFAGTNVAPQVVKLTQIRRSADVFVFVEEHDPRGFNGGSWVMPYQGDSWVDFPAHFHGNGVCVSFADDHAECWTLTDKRTLALKSVNDFFAYTPNNADLRRFEQHVGYWPNGN